MDLGVVCLSENWHERQSPKEYFKKPFWKHVENMTARQKKVMSRIYGNILAHLRNTENPVVTKNYKV